MLSAFGVEHTTGIVEKFQRDGQITGSEVAQGTAVAAGGAGAVAVTPTKMTLPSTSRSRKAAKKIGEGNGKEAKVKHLRRIVQGEGSRFGNDIHTARLAQKIGRKGKNFDPKQPIEVTRYKNGEMMITGGHHRIRAAEDVGMKKAPIKIRDVDQAKPTTITPLAWRRKFKRDVKEARKNRSSTPQKKIDAKAAEKIPKWKEKINTFKGKAEIGHHVGNKLRSAGNSKYTKPVVGAGALTAAGGAAYKYRRENP